MSPSYSYRFLVMERLGIDLQKISDQSGTFKKSTVLQLGTRMVRNNDRFHRLYFQIIYLSWYTNHCPLWNYQRMRDYCLKMSVFESRGYFGEIDNSGLCKWQHVLYLALQTQLGFGSTVWFFPHSIVLHIRTSLHCYKNNISFVNYIYNNGNYGKLYYFPY